MTEQSLTLLVHQWAALVVKDGASILSQHHPPGSALRVLENHAILVHQDPLIQVHHPFGSIRPRDVPSSIRFGVVIRCAGLFVTGHCEIGAAIFTVSVTISVARLEASAGGFTPEEGV